MKYFFPVLTLISCSLFAEIDFTRDIKPILSDKCFNCHGPDGGDYGEKWRGGLRLDTKDDALADMSKTKFETKQRKFKAEGKEVKGKPAEPRYAIIPGDSKNSLLIDRIFTDDPDDIMPPLDSHTSLSEKEKNLIKTWIDQGAPWKQHWAFESPKKQTLPKVSNKSWVKQDLDLFVLEQLEKDKIQPAKRADANTLLRRIALSLTGLPAKAEWVEKVQKQGYAALDSLIDEMLSSKAFGERMAVEWFDNARYADTLDYQYDRNRDAWPWKEWVIRSFQENKPFDDFVREQLAGDLLPNPTQDQILATSFNRLHGISTEGGIIQEEYRIQYVNDRTNTFGTMFLGLTFDCSRCHNHKYDPLTAEDYYSLSAFLGNIKEYSKDTQSYSSRSSTLNYSLTDHEVLKHHKTKLTEMVNKLSEIEKVDDAKVKQWQDKLIQKDYGEKVFDEAQKIDSNNLVWTREIKSQNAHIQSLELILSHDLEGKVNVEIDQLALVKTDKNGKTSEINLKNVFEAHAPKRRNSINNVFKLDQKAWVIDMGQHKHKNTIFKGFALTEDKLELKLSFKKKSTAGVQFQVKLYPESDDLIVAREKHKSKLFNALAKPSYVHYYKSFFPKKAQTMNYVRAQMQHDNEKNRHLTVLVMDERPADQMQKSYILHKGDYDKRGKEVGMATPKFLPAMKKDQPLNRLGLANWLFTEEQPLFARVSVNRIWQMLFGMGIVKTADDFGSQGEQPTHPKLLDHLAVEFRNSDWNLQQLIKNIVTSATFQQSSFERSELNDPENKKLARGPRFRMHAEFVRDQALAVSGLLTHHEKGQKPVYPYQPEGLWKELTNRPGSQMVYKESTGEDLYRRSVYTYWKRAQPNPSFVAFDAPKRGVCTVTRSKTNTPLQALVTWHDPTYIEAARAFAEKAYPKREQKNIFNEIFLETFHRPIKQDEEQTLSSYFDELFKKYQVQPEKVKSILSIGELDQSQVENPAWVAAFSSVCLALFNTSEFVTLQ